MRNGFRVILVVLLAALVCAGCGKSTDSDLFENGKRLEANGEYSKALTNYTTLAKVHETSSLRAEALCRAGLIKVVRQNDVEKALAFFKQVRSEYPQEIIGQGCDALVSFLESDKADNEVDRLYNIGLAYTNLINDFPVGVGVLVDLVEKFPKSTRAPEALFMCGFTLANSASDTARARLIYNRFLNEYPENALVVSVKWELKHLGQDINSIPEMQEINNKPVK